MTASGSADLEALGLVEAIRHVPAAVAVFGRGGDIVYANAQAQALTERTLGEEMPEDLSGGFEIYHLDGRPYRRDEWPVVRSLRAGEQVVDEEYFHRLPDGARVVIRCSSSPVHDARGVIVAGVLVMVDITDDERVRDRLATFERLLENTDDAIIGTDADFLVTTWNAGAERLYGYRAGEVLGRHAGEIASYAGDQSRRELESELLRRDRSRTELTAVRKDGKRVDVDMMAVAVRDSHGHLVGYLGVHRDMTERKRAEDERAAAQQRIETILESIAEAFVAVDSEWRYIYVNDLALARMRERLGPGLRREDVLGREMWALFPEIVGTEFYDRYQEVMRERHPLRFEAYLPVTGEWLEANAYPSDGGLSIYYRDVGDRKGAEAESAARAHQQAVVAALGVQALGEADPQAVMDEAVAAVARTLDVELAGVTEIAAGGNELLLRAGVGWKDGAIGTGTGRSGTGSLVGYTAMVGAPVVSEDLPADPRFRVSPFLAEYEPVSAVTVVLPGRNEPFGVLGAFTKQRRRFSEDDVNFMQAVANVISVAFETARTETRFREVRDAERRRIARDLHDEALQRLALALAEANRRSSSAEPGPGDELVGLLEGVGQQLRGAVYDLRLEEDEHQALADRLRALVGIQATLPTAARIGLDVSDTMPDLTGRRATEVLRMVGEALANARRHAEARHIRVRAAGSRHSLRIEVADDGRGFEPDARPSVPGSTGLRGMRERADLVGADLRIGSAPGGGTTVRMELALMKDTSAAQPVRILLVEDHAAVREAIAAMFEREPDFKVVGQAGSLAQARGMLAGVDVALLDLGLPDGFGPDLIKELRRQSPRADALVLSAAVDRANLARAVESGAAGAVDKLAHLGEVVDAVRRLRAGETLLALDEVVELVGYERRRREQEAADRDALARLTPREREVLQALADGLDSQAIADRLRITLRTERNHVANVLSKLDVHSQLQALVFCLRYDAVEIR
jgi:PAS domain S-box-containing protein